MASAHPSLDEASGDAALRADPESAEAFAAAIEAALAAGEAQIALGLEHAGRFTARAQGDAVLRAYERAS